MLLEKLNKLFDDAYLFEDDVEEDEKGEYIEMYEVSDDSLKCLTFTTMSYIDAINKINDLMKHFAQEYREYEKYKNKKIHFYITKNKYYINEERDEIIEVIEDDTLFWSEMEKGI